MDTKTVEINEERGEAMIHGERFKLAREIKPTDKGRWYVYADQLKRDERYDVVIINERGEVCAIWSGYYYPNMFALRVLPVWAAGGKNFKRLFIAERMVKLRKITDDEKP